MAPVPDGIQLVARRVPRPDAHAEAGGAKRDIVARVVRLGAELDQAQLRVGDHEVVAPEVLEQGGNVLGKAGLVRGADPGEDAGAAGVLARVECAVVKRKKEKKGLLLVYNEQNLPYYPVSRKRFGERGLCVCMCVCDG